MDYEKEYKELVGKIDKAYLYAQTDSTKAVLEGIRPELKESEDEKVREQIVYAINKLNVPESEKNKLLAWLEKQGKQKTSLSEDDEKIRNFLISTYTGLPEDSTFGGFLCKDILTWLEKQGEQVEINPTEFDLRLNRLLKQFESLPKEELASSLSFYLNVVQNDGTYKQKPIDENVKEALRTEYEKGRADAIAEMQEEWRDEDDDLLVSIEDSLSDYLNYTMKDKKLTKHGQDIAELRVLGYIDWLKSIKQRIGGKV